MNVITEVGAGRIAGYVTLSAAQIERAFLPRPQQRNRPDPVPATLLGQLAVDKAFQGQGIAASLLLFALRTALVASETIAVWELSRIRWMMACVGSMPDGDFRHLPFDPRRAMFVRMVDLRESFAGWALKEEVTWSCSIGVRPSCLIRQPDLGNGPDSVRPGSLVRVVSHRIEPQRGRQRGGANDRLRVGAGRGLGQEGLADGLDRVVVGDRDRAHGNSGDRRSQASPDHRLRPRRTTRPSAREPTAPTQHRSPRRSR